jgi:predicted transcriptional regulator of viral defense system
MEGGGEVPEAWAHTTSAARLPTRSAHSNSTAQSRNRRLPVEQRKQELLRLVGEQPMVTASDLASILGLSQPRISQLTSALAGEGRLERSGGGYILSANATAGESSGAVSNVSKNFS